MARRSLCCIFMLSLLGCVLALQVTPNSPCSSQCIDSSTLDVSDPNSSTTTTDDIVCEDADFTSSSTGSKWKSCMSCLQNSTFSQGEESDQHWFLYNLRYSFDYCVYGYPDGTGSGSNPCETSTACGALKTAMQYSNLSSDSSDSEFGYCDTDGGSVTGSYYDACFNCVSAGGDMNYIANGCEQRPNTTALLGLSGSVFSSSVIAIVDPSTVNNPAQSSAVQLSTAAIAGIAAGSAALVVLVAAVTVVCCRRRRNRANLGIEPRWGRTNNKHKRQSSFSFRCRNILASPISPKFFRDLSPVDEQQPYGSLDEQVATTTASNGAAAGNQNRYYIESKQNLWRHPYETSLDGWGIQEGTAPPPQSDVATDQWNTFTFPEKQSRAKKTAMTIDTGLAAPPPAHQSPKGNVFDISHTRRPPQTTAQQQPTYIPTDHVTTTAAATMPMSSSSSTSPPPPTSTPTSQQTANSPSRVKPKTTTMSSQGSGYPKLKSPTWSSPMLRPAARDDSAPEPWFPPPPPPGPPPPTSLASRYGRKVSGGGPTSPSRKGKRESGSPVESKKIQVYFPGPPGR